MLSCCSDMCHEEAWELFWNRSISSQYPADPIAKSSSVKTRSMLTSASTRLLQAPKLATVEQLKEQKRKAVEVEDYELLGPPFWSVFYDFITCWRFLPGDSVYPWFLVRCKFQDCIQARMSHDFIASFDMSWSWFHDDSHEIAIALHPRSSQSAPLPASWLWPPRWGWLAGWNGRQRHWKLGEPWQATKDVQVP